MYDDVLQSIRSRMELVCKCHGVSGSCTMKVCWRKMAAFAEVNLRLALSKPPSLNFKSNLLKIIHHHSNIFFFYSLQFGSVRLVQF